MSAISKLEQEPLDSSLTPPTTLALLLMELRAIDGAISQREVFHMMAIATAPTLIVTLLAGAWLSGVGGIVVGLLAGLWIALIEFHLQRGRRRRRLIDQIIRGYALPKTAIGVV